MLENIKRLASLKPNPILLGQGRDNNYYWIYYAGMGSMSFSRITDREQQELIELIHKGDVVILEEIIEVGVHAMDLDKFLIVKFKKVVTKDGI